HAAESCGPDRNRYRPTKVFNLHSANHPVGRQHRNSTHAPFAKMLLYLCDHIHGSVKVKAFRCDTKRLVNRRKIILKFNVNDRADDLYELADLYVSVICHSAEILL